MIEPIEGDKECNKCRQCLPVSAFGYNVAQKDGRERACRDCRNKGKREPRTGWPPFADEVIVTRYATHGAEGCRKLLPERSIAAIQKRASQLKVTVPLAKFRELPFQPDATLHRTWQQIDRGIRANPAQNLSWGIG